MSELRQRMLEDMRLAGLAATTQERYVRAVRRLVKTFMRPPDGITEAEIRRYVLDMRDRRRCAEGRFKKVVKGQRYNLLRNPEKLTEAQAVRLSDLLALNATLHATYVLKEAFRHLWTYVRRAWAEKYLARWTAWAEQSAVEPIRRFARNLAKWKDAVLAYFQYPITTAPLEAFNATVSRIIYRSCGVQDMDYLFLKLRQESLRPHLQT